MRLEGWQQVFDVHPSFEMRAYGALLRMRLKGEAITSGRRLSSPTDPSLTQTATA